MQNPEILHGTEATIDYQLPDFELPYQPPVLPVDLYLKIEKHRYRQQIFDVPERVEKSSSIEDPKQFQVEMENIHNKAIFDGLNEALDGMRPYGLRGPPVPWSKQNKTLTFKFGTSESIPDVFNDAKKKVISWAKHQVGGLMEKSDSDNVRK